MRFWWKYSFPPPRLFVVIDVTWCKCKIIIIIVIIVLIVYLPTMQISDFTDAWDRWINYSCLKDNMSSHDWGSRLVTFYADRGAENLNKVLTLSRVDALFIMLTWLCFGKSTKQFCSWLYKNKYSAFLSLGKIQIKMNSIVNTLNYNHIFSIFQVWYIYVLIL